MMPHLEQLDKQEAEGGTFEVELYVLKFGGKVASEGLIGDGYTKKGRGSARGYMELLPLKSPEDLKAAVALFKTRAEKFLGGLEAKKE